jgi:selenocysteine lyase/cysteine desulfurase
VSWRSTGWIFINLHGLEASLEFVEGVTIKSVNAHCRRLLQRLEEGLCIRGYILSAGSAPGHESTILGFHAGSDAATAELHQKPSANQIAVSLRQGMIRVSPYLYNDEADIDRLLEIARPI